MDNVDVVLISQQSSDSQEDQWFFLNVDSQDLAALSDCR